MSLRAEMTCLPAGRNEAKQSL